MPDEMVPRITDEMRRELAESETLTEELFDLAGIFGANVTNNDPRVQDGVPLYHVADFIGLVKEAFLRHGWTPPERGRDV